MFKTSFLIFLIVIPYGIAFGQECKLPNIGSERRVCSHMIVEIRGVVTSQLKGRVVDANGEGIRESIVEINDAKENGNLVSTIKTDHKGRFCIKNLRRGKYLLRVGWSRLGFNCTDIEVEIRGKTRKLVVIPLEVGT